MYDIAKKAREAMKGKARRLAGEPDRKVDSSDWTQAEPMNAEAKTGLRPISKRAYKAGGKVEGACAPTHAGRKPRKAGGRVAAEEKAEAKDIAIAKVNRNVKEANEEREGEKHVGGMKKGGRAGKDGGGSIGSKIVGALRSLTGTKTEAEKQGEQLSGVGSKGTATYGDKDKGEMAEAAKRKSGGRTKKAGGGPLDTDFMGGSLTHKKDGGAAEKKRPGKFYGGALGAPGGMPGGMPGIAPAIGQQPMGGAPVPMGGMAPAIGQGGFTTAPGGMGMGMGAPRMGRKAGGRAKGKTNINIVIGHPGAGAQPAGGPGAMPPPPPPMGVPMGAPPMGGMPGMPPALPAGLPPMGAGGPPPMARKAGGRVYRSYKDMDAGAGSGEGRLEKTEIQKRKK